MNLLLLLFAFPIATIIFSIVLQKIIRSPILVALTIFAAFLIATFTVFDESFLIFTILYTIISYITAVITRFIKRILKRIFCNENDNESDNSNDNDNNSDDENNSDCGCNCRNGLIVNNNNYENRRYWR